MARLRKVAMIWGRQDLPYQDQFDGVMCVDAMEFVPPEDWPVVLERFRRALRSGAGCT